MQFLSSDPEGALASCRYLLNSPAVSFRLMHAYKGNAQAGAAGSAILG